jgi:hypothetical protein
MKRALVGLVFGLAVAAAPALAQPPAAPAPDDGAAADASEADAQSGWIKRLDDAAARITAAQKNLDKLEDAKGRGAARRYPRGDAKAKYLDGLEAARKELADAREALPELVEEARRAGIENGVLDRYENFEPVADEPAADEDE